MRLKGKGLIHILSYNPKILLRLDKMYGLKCLRSYHSRSMVLARINYNLLNCGGTAQLQGQNVSM